MAAENDTGSALGEVLGFLAVIGISLVVSIITVGFLILLADIGSLLYQLAQWARLAPPPREPLSPIIVVAMIGAPIIGAVGLIWLLRWCGKDGQTVSSKTSSKAHHKRRIIDQLARIVIISLVIYRLRQKRR